MNTESATKNLIKRNKFPRFLRISAIVFVAIFTFAMYSLRADSATAPSTISYQGKLLISGYSASTTQQMYFILYDSLSGGSILYTASGTIGTPNYVNVTPILGLFTVDLGDTGTNALDPDIFKDNSNIYLEVRIGAETLTPRKKITATPYSFNSRYLDGVAPSTNTNTTYIPISDSSGNFNFNNVTSTGAHVSGLLNVIGNSYFGTIASGTWNGTAISNVRGGTGADSSGWTGFAYVNSGNWMVTTTLASSSLASNVMIEGDDISLLYNDIGYITGFTEVDPIWSAVSTSLTVSNFTTNTVSQWTNDIGYITGFTEVDPYWTIASNTYQNYFLDSSGTLGQLWQSDGDGRGAWANTSSLGFTGSSIGGFTAGSVIFASSSGALTQDNPNFFWDDANNRLGIGTTTPLSMFHINDGGLLVTGSTGATPVSGVGGRLMWVPAKSAFRAGAIMDLSGYGLPANTDQWDEAYVGSASFAAGINSQATGNGDTAFGISTIASGTAAFASGWATRSTGWASTALGYFTTSSNTGSLSAGRYTVASGLYSVAFGSYSSSTGSSAVAMGDSSYAAGANSLAGGSGSITYASNALAFGSNAQALAINSVAIGTNVKTTLTSEGYNFALGYDVQAGGKYHYLLGKDIISAATSLGATAFAFGRNIRIEQTADNSMIFNVGDDVVSSTQPNTLALMGGNVGIGTTTPQNKLVVDGNIDVTAENYYKYNGVNFAMASTTLNNYFTGGAGNLAMTGMFNTALGSGALLFNSSGGLNTAIGASSLILNSSGSFNVAMGVYALSFNSTGDANTAIGQNALQANTAGTGNTAVGYLAGYGDEYTDNMHSNIDTYSTFIGYQASRDPSVPTSTVLTNATAIGYNARVGASNSLILGGTGVERGECRYRHHHPVLQTHHCRRHVCHWNIACRRFRRPGHTRIYFNVQRRIYCADLGNHLIAWFYRFKHRRFHRRLGHFCVLFRRVDTGQFKFLLG